jgi:hypothetical protein
MTILAEIFAFTGLFFLLGVLASIKYFDRIRPSAAMMFFLVLQYGPLFLLDVRHSSTADPDYSFGISDFGPQIARYTYTALAVAFCGIAIGYFVVHLAAGRVQTARVTDLPSADAQPGPRRETLEQFYYVLLGLACVTSAALLSLSAIRQQLSFVAHLATGHVGASDYTTMRRIILPSDPFYLFLARLRMNYSLPLMSLLTAFSFYLKRPVLERIVVLSIFGIVALLELQKQSIAIAILTVVICGYLAKRKAVFPKPKDLALVGSILVGIAVLLLFGLYQLQYSGDSLISGPRIVDAIYFRVFQADGIDLDMLFMFVKHGLWAQGQTTSSILAALFNKKFFYVDAYIPQVYGSLTTYPTIFFGSEWVDFGWTGIVLSSLCVGAFAALADFVASTLRVIPVRAAYSVCAMFALNYFTQIEFLTCLLTSGIVIQMFLFMGLDYLVAPGQAHVGPPSGRHLDSGSRPPGAPLGSVNPENAPRWNRQVL